MSDALVPREGQILTGSLFNEPVRIANVRSNWLYVVTRCKQAEGPQVMLIGDPARLAWHEVKKVEHYQLSVDTLRSQPGGGTRT